MNPSLFYNMISSQVAFIRMKWDKLNIRDAVMVHLFRKSKVLEPKLPTALPVHMVSVVFAFGKLQFSSIKIRFGWHWVLIEGLSLIVVFVVAIYFKRNAKISYFKKVSIYFASEILLFDWLAEETKWIPGKAFLWMLYYHC